MQGFEILHSKFEIRNSKFIRTMAEETPDHEVRPTTQEMKIPARFIPTPTVEPGHTFASVTDHISSIVLRRRMPLLWSIVFAIGTMLVIVLMGTITWLIAKGVGIWGMNHPVG